MFIRYRKSANFIGVPVRKLQNCKFPWLIRKSRSRIFYKILHNSVTKQPKKSAFERLIFYFVLWINAFFAIFLRRKSMYLRTCGSFNSANHKKIGSANLKSAKCLLCWRSANLTNYYYVRKFTDLQFVELICGLPTFGTHNISYLYTWFASICLAYFYLMQFIIGRYWISAQQSFCAYFSLLYICFSSLYIITVILSI